MFASNISDLDRETVYIHNIAEDQAPFKRNTKTKELTLSLQRI